MTEEIKSQDPVAAAGANANQPGNANAANQGSQDPAAAAPAEGSKKAQAVDSSVEGFEAPKLVRSDLIPNSYRYMQEQEDFMVKLDAGSGLLGTGQVNEKIEQKKRDVCNLTNAGVLPTSKDILDRLRDDGIYVDDPEINQKFTDINVQKLEERLLNNKKSEFFKSNGEIKLDNDLLQDEITRPADLAFEETIAYQKKEVNAVLSDRMHSHKKKYYRLDIIVGKINMFNCLNVFGEEDKLALDLREQFKDYETRASLAMIPFYQQRLDHIKDEIAHKEEDNAVTDQDRDFLQRMLVEANKAYEKEKREIDELANKLYETWQKLEARRTEQKFISTNVQLQVYKSQINELEEINFDLIRAQIPEKQSLPGPERSRQTKAKKLEAYCKLLINGKKVAATKKALLKFPAFEISVDEMFQVHLFTMPSSIQLALFVVDGLKQHEVDMINVEVPGTHVKALTCAASLVRQLPFSKVDFERSKDTAKYEELFKTPDPSMKPAQKKKHDAKLAAEEQKEKNDIQGEIFVKVEWKGEGPKMPPVKSENLFKKAKAGKNRNEFTASQETLILLKQLYLDVNDPRNQFIIKLLKESKNEFLVKLLFEDSKNLLSDSAPFRHKLLAARHKVAGLAKMFVPMLENELIDSTRSSYFLDQLEVLYKSEAYMAHLDKRAAVQEANEADFGAELDRTALLSLETLKRRQEIFEALKSRAMDNRDSNSGATSNYNAVIEEVQVQTTNPMFAIFNKFFQTGRKLKPIVAPRETVPFESVKECKIFVHCIQGENIPIRNDFFEEYQQSKRQEKTQQNIRPGSQRPTANQPGGFNMQNVQADVEEAGPAVRNIRDLYNVPQVETFVEVRIQYYSKWAVVKRTRLDEGKMPRWNEVLEFNLEAENMQNFTKEELVSSQTEIIFTLFDKQEYEQSKDHMRVITEENRYLGSFTIPLHTVLQNPGKTEFNFKLNRPIALPNYRVLDSEILLMDEGDFKEAKLREWEQLPSYLNVSISLDPAISLPTDNAELSYPGFEHNSLLTAGSEWSLGCKTLKGKAFVGRQAKVFGENIYGQSVLICRYLAAQAPPEEVFRHNDPNPDANKYAIETAARFVSLIPFKSDLSMFKDMPDTFCDSQQFLDLGAGDYEEHAVLLANYFKYIDQKSGKDKLIDTYLVFGEALPDGSTVFVMRKEKATGNLELWAPITGECYFYKLESNKSSLFNFSGGSFMQIRLADPGCPLRKLHTVISDRNVWFNTQKHDLPVLMDFDLTKKAKWRVLFEDEALSYSKYFKGGELLSIQQPFPKYSDNLPKKDCDILESRIQKYLVEQFQDSRIKKVRKTTKWAVTSQKELRAALISCEEHSMRARQGGTTSTLRGLRRQDEEDLPLDAITKQLKELGKQERSKRSWGYPISCSFVSLDKLWKLVEQTRMHEVNRLDIEFAMAIYIKPYPANILSVWIYLAAFVDKTMEQIKDI